jgi:hypothetical protein
MTDYWSYTPLGQDWILQVWCGHALMGEQIGMLPWKWKFEDATDLILAHAKEHSALLQEIL